MTNTDDCLKQTYESRPLSAAIKQASIFEVLCLLLAVVVVCSYTKTYTSMHFLIDNGLRDYPGSPVVFRFPPTGKVCRMC